MGAEQYDAQRRPEWVPGGDNGKFLVAREYAMQTMKAEGWSTRAIARYFGIHRRTVGRALSQKHIWEKSYEFRREELKWRVRKLNLVRRDYNGRDRAKKHGAEWKAVNLLEVLERFDYRCHLCAEPVQDDDLHFDHIVPFSRGGIHHEVNIAPAHATCNLRKRDKLMCEL